MTFIGEISSSSAIDDALFACLLTIDTHDMELIFDFIKAKMISQFY
jgi:hypothetical protein